MSGKRKFAAMEDYLQLIRGKSVSSWAITCWKSGSVPSSLRHDGAEIGIPYMDKRYQAAELAILEKTCHRWVCRCLELSRSQTITTKFSGLKN